MNPETRLPEFLAAMSTDLDRCINFWLEHSHDDKYGGFLNCLGKDGKVYDEHKYGWMQGRQVYMYAWLYNNVERYKTGKVLTAAEQGAEFMLKHMKVGDSYKLYFQMTREGAPVKIQRTFFTESFFVMAMAELWRATGNQLYKGEAVAMMDHIIHWVRVDSTELGRPSLAGMQPTNSNVVPILFISLIDQLETIDPSLSSKYQETLDWSIEQFMMHIQRDGEWILENVAPDGSELPGCAGRLTIPGHAIEGGWFLLQLAKRKNRANLVSVAIEKFIVKPFDYGWDKEHGGLFYFLDADGLSPVQLEWNMKMWWAHNEALIALLMAYQETDDVAHLAKFEKVFDYSFKHFSDKEHGEWFGYLSQEGKVNNDFKGGPFKGCFHVPRCLAMCEKILKEIIAKKKKVPTATLR